MSHEHKLGSEFTQEEQQYILRTDVNRYTGDHTPRWAKDSMKKGAYPVCYFKSDVDWLASTAFKTRNDGCLDHRSIKRGVSKHPADPQHVFSHHESNFIDKLVDELPIRWAVVGVVIIIIMIIWGT